MPKIFVLTGPDVGHSFDVESGAVFGRADDCTVRLADASVSRHHARLESTPAGWSIVDLGSRNGVFWDGERVERVSLEDGREFTLGEVALKFRLPAVRTPPPAAVVVQLAEPEEIVLEGDWDETKSPKPTAAPADVTAFTARAPVAAETTQPSLARQKATERLAAAGALPARTPVGARGVLQYQKIESKSGFLQSDFDQQPFWVKIVILLTVLVVVAGLSWLAFRMVVVLRGTATDAPVIEESAEEPR